jgi:hypothetical protein
MRPRPSLADFVEEELLRAPLVFDAAIDALDLQWRKSPAVLGRAGSDLARTLAMHRAALMAAALHTLRTAATQGSGGAPRAISRASDLSLVDEADVVADLETGRCAERIGSEAEAELREMHAYTSALMGDLAVSRDTNPFQPARYARALWDGCQALPVAPAVRIDAYRRTTVPLAQAVRASLAAACRRLEALGVTPANYRTLIFPTVPSGGGRERVHAPADDPTTLRDTLAAAADAGTAGAPAAPQVELVHKLSAEIAAEGGLAADMPALLARLEPALERAAANDESMVHRLDHPAWQFVDRLAYLLAVTPPAEQPQLLELARNLVGRLDADPAPDAARFAWAAAKLDMHDRQALTFAVRAAAGEITRLSRTVPEAAESLAVTGGGRESQWLDIGGLDTVPAQMIEAPPGGSARGSDPSPGPEAGDRLRIFLQGEWRWLQLLWSREDLWLLRELTRPGQWALQPGVIERLRAEHLVRPLRMRSLVQRAAERLHRRH